MGNRFTGPHTDNSSSIKNAPILMRCKEGPGKCTLMFSEKGEGEGKPSVTQT